MLWRVFLSGSAVILGFVGIGLLDCTFSLLEFVDMIDACVETDVAIPGGSIAVGAALVAASVALLTYSWVPYFLDRYREKEGMEETSRTFAENVHRLPGEIVGPVENLLPNGTNAEQPETVSEDV